MWRGRRASHELDQRAARAEPGVELMPVIHAVLAELPAEPDLAARRERREVDEPALDVAEGDPESIDACHGGGHLVHDPLHPEPDAARLLRVGGRILTTATTRSRRGRDGRITEPDELGTLVREGRQERRHLWQRRVRTVDVEEGRHPAADSTGTRTTGASGRSRPGFERVPSGHRRGPRLPSERPVDDTGGGMDLGLGGARALVGGGSGGLGGAVAEALAGEGARVALVARASDRLDAAAARLAGAIAVGADLASRDGPTDSVARTVDAFGGLDVLLVNSGGPPPGTFDELDDAAWERAIDGTLWSALRLIRAALPHLRGSDRPAIVVNLSSSAREPIPGLATSNLLRPGLAGLIKSLVQEIAPVRINGLAPGRISTARIGQLDAANAARTGATAEEISAAVTARIPLGRYGDPAEFGRLATFLLSPAASYVTGAIVPIDGGMVRALP